ncbi:MAG: hypothetical protein GY788_09175 [bacterium]|nr:hypothetical protein [bacterium]
MLIRRSLLILAVVAASFASVPAATAIQSPVLANDDWEAPIVVVDDIDATGIQGVLDDDPNGLVPKTPFVQRYSLDTDHWEVWRCGSVSTSVSDLVDELEAATVDYFQAISGGSYTPSFTAGGSIGASSCVNGFLSGANPTMGTPEGILIVDDITNGGYASPGSTCTGSGTDCPTIGISFPSNGRYLVIGEDVLLDYASVAAHELGHTLQWPHSYSGTAGSNDYDNPIDVMSGNSRELGRRITEPDPYSTLSFNRYQSGWVTASDVVVADGSDQSLTLQPFDATGTQLLVVKTATTGQFYAFGARRSSSFDPIPASWEGVEVYFVDHLCDESAFGGICPGIWREHLQQPPGAQQILHVLTPGESIALEGLTIEVVASVGTGFTIAIDGPAASTVPGAPGTPTVAGVADGSANLVWNAASNGGSDILNYDLQIENQTAGGSVVTDVELGLTETIDDLINGNSYRARVRAINAIGPGAWSSWSADLKPSAVPAVPGTPTATAFDAAVGVEWTASPSDGGSEIVRYEVQLNNQTTGSNAVSDAGLLLSVTVTELENGDTYRARVRAVSAAGAGAWTAWSGSVTPSGAAPPPPPPPSGDTFVDDGDSVFEDDIEWLAATGITRGCNPPADDRYCPTASVTRGQMAAFLVRALGLTATGSIGFSDDDNSVFEDDIEKLAASAITTGCNAAGTRFCPDQSVTRGQMAAFLVRALDLKDVGSVDFVDDDQSIFEDDIEKLATAGITTGCNAAGTEFCPNDPVTRGQMAAFLRRALDKTG